MRNLNNARKFYVQLIAVLIVLFLSIQCLLADTTVAPDRGYAANKSYTVADIESISVQSGNLMFNVPVGSLPAGRGGLSGGISLMYNSKLWDISNGQTADRNGVDVDCATIEKSPEGGWHYGYKYYFITEVAGSLFRIMLVTPDGARHLLTPLNGTSGDGDEAGAVGMYFDGRYGPTTPATPGQTIQWFTTDNTFLRVEVLTDSDLDDTNNRWTIYMPDGSRVVVNPPSGNAQRQYDRNGNYLDIIETISDSNYSNHKTTYLKDNLERKVVIEYNTGTGIDQDTIHTPGFNGADLQTKVVWKNIIVNQIYEFSGGVPPTSLPLDYWAHFPLNKTLRVVDKVHLPEDSSSSFDPYYEFSYNADATTATDTGWGEVSEVQSPTGAKTHYTYVYDSMSGSWIMDPLSLMSNGVITKTLTYDLQYDGSVTPTTDTWTYAIGGAPQGTFGSVTGPDGGVMKEYYRDSLISGIAVRGELVKIENPDGSVVDKVYATNSPGAPSNSLVPNQMLTSNRYVKYEIVTIPGYSGSASKVAFKKYLRDKNGNVTEVWDYDYVDASSVIIPRDSDGYATGLPSSGISGALKRITKTEYYNDTPEASTSTYTDADSYHVSTSPRLLGLVKSAEVQDASGNPKSRSELDYDFKNYSSSTIGGNLKETKSWDSFKGGSTRAYSNPLTSTNSISTSATYDSYGNPLTTTDANLVTTTITYGCIDGSTSCSSSPWLKDLYPTKTEAASNFSALKRTSTAVYDFNTGLVKSAKDEDNNVTSTTDYDDLGRPVKAAAAVGEAEEVWTKTEYDDQYRKVIVKSDLATKGDGKKVAAQFYDQLGRVRLSKTLEDAAAQSATNEEDGIKVQTRYLTTSGYTYQLTSNPYRADYSYNATGETTMGWTRSKTQTDGKHSEVETFTGAVLPQPFLTSGYNTSTTGKVQTDIDADRTMVTDQAGKQRISKTNAFGQLMDVWEILPSSDSASVSVVNVTSSSSLYAYHTAYTYDYLNNLASVSQPIGSSGGQSRSFSYNTLSRLLSATNPESGTITYKYDDNGNLTSKLDARNITTTYIYDKLNRITERSYNDSITPTATYTYDGVTNAKGKLTKVVTGNVSTPFSVTDYQAFDKMGRVTQSQQSTDGTNPDPMYYTYNISGALIEETYPSGRKVKNVLDASGDLSIVQSKKGTGYGYWNYADSFTYTAAGAVSSMQLGNFRRESTAFNSRLQPTEIALGSTPGATDILKLDYSYGTTQNNGNILTQTIKVPDVPGHTGFTAVQTYSYDSLNRIHDAAETISSTQTWKQTFSYDRFGNRNFDESNTSANNSFPKGCTGNTIMCAADRKVFNPDILTGNKFKPDQDSDGTDDYQYDAGGNTTRDVYKEVGGTIGYRRYTYDGENKQIKVETLNSGGTVTGRLGEYWYDGDGKRVKKITYDQYDQPKETTIFVYDASGREVAEYSTIVASQQDAKVNYLINDHLGSPRINTDQNGAVTARHDYQPFGEELTSDQSSQRIAALGYGSDDVRKKFTGYERDEETDLDFAQARMYAKQLGRFISPDDFVNDTKANYPQSWNLFAYVRNNPMRLVDPTGEKAEVTIKRNKKTKTGTIEISASFVVYAADGQNISEEDLNKQKGAIELEIEKTYSGTYKAKDGYTYTISANITVETKSNEEEAKKAVADDVAGNIVEVGNKEIISKDGKEKAWASSFRYEGENFDRMMVNISNKNAIYIGNTYSHEFTHLLGNYQHSADQSDVRSINFYTPWALTERDKIALFAPQIRQLKKVDMRRASLLKKGERIWAGK